MNYHFANSIIHPEKVVSDKVNYFADHFQFTLINLCRPGFDEFENHKSLLEKIRTQIESNEFGLSKKFIEHYMSNVLLEKNNFIVRNFYEEEFKALRKLWSQNKVEKVVHEDFLSGIEKIIDQLEESLFENCLNHIIDAIHCKLPLERHGHIELFDNCVPILVSELKFSGLSDKNLNRLFDNLFTKEVRKSGKRILTEAPLPPELLKLKRNPESDPDKVFNAVQDYLHNMGLKNQFWGLYHIYKNSALKRTFLFKIKDVKSRTDIDIEYGGVRFSNQLKNGYVTSEVSRKGYIEFFKDELLLVEVHVTTNTRENGKQEAIRRIQEALYYFNAFFEEDARIDLGDYIIRDDDQNYRFKSISTALDTREIEKFDDASLFKFFGNRTSKPIDRIKKLDKVFFQAKTNPLQERQLVLLWTYLEAFFRPKEDPKKLRSNIALISSKGYVFDDQLNMYNVVFKIIYNQRENEMTVSSDAESMNGEPNSNKTEINRFLKIHQLEDFPFREVGSTINHPYLSKHLEWFNESTDEEKVKMVSEHFERILLEAYEQRNLVVHAGVHNEKAVQKIMLILPDIVACFRCRMIRVLKEQDFKTLAEAIEHSKS